MIRLHVFAQNLLILEIHTTNAAHEFGGRRMLLGGVHLQGVHIGEQLFAQFASIAGVLLFARLVMRLELLKIDGLEVARHALVDLGGLLAGFLGTAHLLLLMDDRCDGCVLAQLLRLVVLLTARRVKEIGQTGLQWVDRPIDGAHFPGNGHFLLDFGTIALSVAGECLTRIESLHFGGRLLDSSLLLSGWRIVRCDSVLFVD